MAEGIGPAECDTRLTDRSASISGEVYPPLRLTYPPYMSAGLGPYSLHHPTLPHPGSGASQYGESDAYSQYPYASGLTRPAGGPVPKPMGKQNVLPLPGVGQMQSQDAGFDTTGQQAPAGKKPRVTATLWEDGGTLCFQVEARGVCVARREDNHMINGTKLLNVAGMTRGRRDSILKSEKVRQVVKIGPMHLKGVWIPYERALDFANKEKITEMLYPLFVHDIAGLLYHPANMSRTGQVMATAARREMQEATSGKVLGDTELPHRDEPEELNQRTRRHKSTDISGKNNSGAALAFLQQKPPIHTPMTAERSSHSPTKWPKQERRAGPTPPPRPSLFQSTYAERESECSEDSWTDSSSAGGPSCDRNHPLFDLQEAYLRKVMDGYYQNQSNVGNENIFSFSNHTHESGSHVPAGSQGLGAGQSGLGKRKRVSKAAKEELKKEPRALFACPFAKKDPIRHRLCYKYTLSRIRDVKQHLRRYHLQPVFCPRCGEIFNDADERNTHFLRNTVCPIQQFVTPAGMTEKQERQTRQRSSSQLSEEEQWYAVFEIIFPGCPRPLSPYVDQSLSEEMMTFRDYMAAEGPGLLSNFLIGTHVVMIPPSDDEQAVFQQNTLAGGLLQIFDRFVNTRAPTSNTAASETNLDPLWLFNSTGASSSADSGFDLASTDFGTFSNESRTTPGSNMDALYSETEEGNDDTQTSGKRRRYE